MVTLTRVACIAPPYRLATGRARCHSPALRSAPPTSPGANAARRHSRKGKPCVRTPSTIACHAPASTDQLAPSRRCTMLSIAIQRPLRAETVVLLLDDQRRGVAIAVVSGTHRPDDVLEVVECLTRAPPTAAGSARSSSPACARRSDGGRRRTSRRRRRPLARDERPRRAGRRRAARVVRDRRRHHVPTRSSR